MVGSIRVLSPQKLKKRSLFLALAWYGLLGCGAESDKTDPEVEEGVQNPTTTAGTTSSKVQGVSGQTKVSYGDVILQKVSVPKQGLIQSVAQFSKASLAGLDPSQVEEDAVEIFLVDAAGEEVAYVRTERTKAELTVKNLEEGTYTVVLKDNSEKDALFDGLTTTGPSSSSQVEKSAERINAPFKNTALKGVVVFARQCMAWSADGSRSEVTTASEGSYFAQAFVFLGSVSSSFKVTPLSSATISLSLGQVQQPLVPISKLPSSSLKDYDMPADPDIIRTFYREYFGGAGELYTHDTFLYGGDCSKAPQFPLGTDVGLADVRLKVEDSTTTPPLKHEFPIRATLSPAMSLYLGDGSRNTQWTPCSFDPKTASPILASGTSGTCIALKEQEPPYLKLDYKLPSETQEGVTPASDPTRVLIYGYSNSKSWYQELIAKRQDLLNTSLSAVTIDRCLTTGGLVSVPISSDKTILPLGEMNVYEDDIVNVAKRTGSYTSLVDFYQGNIDASAKISEPTCIPSSDENCAVYKTLETTFNNCSYKADSGISVGSIGTSFIYPSYFELSGVVKK